MQRAIDFWRPEWNRKCAIPVFLRVLNKDEEFALFGRKFIASPGVFSPVIFEHDDVAPDEFYVAELSKVVVAMIGKHTAAAPRLLEIGCGTGCLSISVALNCPTLHVSAVDVSPAAVTNSMRNAERHSVTDRYLVVQSDLFENVPTREKFDLIYFDFPFMLPPEGASKDRDTTHDAAFYNAHYSLLHRFLQGVDAHLATTRGGRVLIKFSNVLGIYEAFETITNDYGWMCKEIARFSIELEKGGDVVDYELIELVRS